jgi:hypothetical protein
MKAPSDRVQKIIKWREVITALPDQLFFDLVRMHLGEIKTPYSKQKLIEDLGIFLQKPEHKETILALLSPFDEAILAAVLHIPSCTGGTLTAFFADVPFGILNDAILNLEERLLLYRYNNNETKKTLLAITPYFEDQLKERLPFSLLFSSPDSSVQAGLPDGQGKGETASPAFLAAMLSFVTIDGDVCKTDGVLKKRTQARLQEIFPAALDPEAAPALEHGVEEFCAAAKRLGLFKDTNSGFVPDFNGWLSFANLEAEERGAYLAAASVSGRASIYEIRRTADLLYRCVQLIPEGGISPALFFRAGFLEQTLEASDSAGDRFNSLIYRNNEPQQPDNEFLKKLVTAAIAFGLILRTETGGAVLYKRQPPAPETEEKKTAVKIDSVFSITVFPDLPFKELIYLTRFLDIKKYDVVLQFEINKNSALRGFAFGLRPEDICARLEKHSEFPLPQNFAVSIDDWFKIYSSAFLYKGYILQVDPDQASKVERLPAVSSRIVRTLTPGIYLMNFFSDEEAAGVLERSGLKQGSELITSAKPAASVSFPGVRSKPHVEILPPESGSGAEGREEEAARIIAGHLETLEQLAASSEMTKEQYDSLKNRIERKIVVDPVQLKAESVRQEKAEATGMDFLGKLHIIEQAAAMKAMIEIEDQGKKITGIPVNIEKLSGNAIVTLKVDTTGQDQRFSVGKLQSVKKLRTSIFKEVKW